jgi:2-keto-4-pentenoate hydratase
MSNQQTSDYLFGLRRDNRAVDTLPDELRPPDLSSAYEAQALLVEQLCAYTGSARAGYKIALTNPIAQSLVGVPHPVFGSLIGKTCFDSGASVPADDCCTRIVEVEFAFVMVDDVPRMDEPYTAMTIAKHVASLHPAIEIVDHRFAALDRFDAFSLAADNAIHGCFVKGPPATAWHDHDLAAHAVKLLVNGKQVLNGAGDRCLGHPLAALAWLANELPAHARDLHAGDYITTGLATDGIFEASRGDHLIGDFGTLGNVEMRFT